MELAAQIISMLGAGISILSFQFRRNNGYYIMQALGGLCFAVSFFMLGTYTAALLNAINIVRGFGFAADKSEKPNVTFAVLSALYIAATVFTYSGYLSVLVCVAQLIGTYVMWSRNPVIMRILQFFAISPLWLYHNLVTSSSGGIVCEAFNMVSVIIYFIRIKFSANNKK